MERITFEGNFCDIAKCQEIMCPYGKDCSQKRVWERLKHYEDMEEQGLLFIKPFKEGETAYYADEDTGRVLMGYVASYEILSDGAVYVEFDNVESDIEWVGIEIPLADARKTVFLTREEAENALAADKNDGRKSGGANNE